jgi:DNA-binding NarL/FixJ family response regulator
MERARTELQATGATLRARTDAREELTPSEWRVAVLAADGLSNREISAQIFLSLKTVEFHLGRVYAKLGLRNRAQLARHVLGPATPTG